MSDEEANAVADLLAALHLARKTILDLQNGEADAWRVTRVIGQIDAAIRAGTPIVADEEDAEPLHTCGICGQPLDLVRPGKYQCPRCG